jgi:cytochrome P450
MIFFWELQISLDHILTPKQSSTTYHTSVGTSTNFFLDLLSSNPDLEYYQKLRDEAEAAFGSDADWTDHASLAKLPLTESAIRETLRHHPITRTGVTYKVISPKGVTLPDGHHLPQGVWIGAALMGVNMDDRFYKDPALYDPFRFTSSSISGTIGHAKSNLVSTSDKFLTWGHGRHSW